MSDRTPSESLEPDYRLMTGAPESGERYVRLTDERLLQLRDDEYVCSNANEQSMADELLELRQWKTRLAQQARRAVEDMDRWHRLYQPVAENPCPDVANLIDAALDERDRLRKRLAVVEQERDLAVAHDRQPYPTAWAFEQACAALEKHRKRADAAEGRIAELEAQLREEGNTVGRLQDQLRTACTEGADARADLADANEALDKIAARVRPDEDGLWTDQDGLLESIGNTVQATGRKVWPE